MIRAFSQQRASRITGLSQRQLEYWDATDVLRPSIAAHELFGLPRLYSFTDLLRLRVAKELRDHRMLPSEIKRMVDELVERGFEEPLLTLRFLSPAETQTGVPARDVYWLDPRTDDVRSARDLNQPVIISDLRLVDVRTGVEGEIAALLERKPGEITQTRGLRGSQPVLDGTRVPTAKLYVLADQGWSRQRIQDAFPQLTAIDVDAAIEYERRRRAA